LQKYSGDKDWPNLFSVSFSLCISLRHYAKENSISFHVLFYNDLFLLLLSVKMLDWGEEGHRSESEVAALRAAFSQEVSVWHKLDHPNVTKVLVLFLHYCSINKFLMFYILEAMTYFSVRTS
jgi:hypothetical protein